MNKILLTLIPAVAFVLGALFAPALLVNVLVVLAVCAGFVYLAANHQRALRRSKFVNAINTLPGNIGSSINSRRYRASAALATRYVFVKAGADDEHIAAIAATSDRPIGITIDEASAAEDPITVELAGINGRTLPCVAGAAIAALNGDVYTDATGKVVVKPTAAGTYWKVGRNLTLATAINDPVEVQPCEPRKLVVVSALESTNGTAAGAADDAALRAEVEKLGDDFRKFAAALDGSADVAIATT